MAELSNEVNVVNLNTKAIDDCWRRIGIKGDRSCPKLKEYIHCHNCPVHAEAANALLDNELSHDTRQQWAFDYAKSKIHNEAQDKAVIIFRIGDELLGLNTKACSEFTEISPIHSLPHIRNGIVLGLVNVRGELLICISLAALLAIDQTAKNRQPVNQAYRRLLIFRDGNDRFATPVDEVFGLVRYNRSELSEIPSTINQAKATYTIGLLPWQGSMAGLLDHNLLIFTANRNLT